MPYTYRATVDLGAQSEPAVWKTIANMGDAGAHRFVVDTKENGNPVDISGARITLHALRHDGATRDIEGRIEDGAAVAELDRSCYEVEGELKCTMVIEREGEVLSAACIYMLVGKSYGDAVVDPSHVVPSLQDIYDELANMRSAEELARAAASDATGAAQTARDAAGRADRSAENADEKASAATSSAASANESAQNADAAAQSANAAALKIDLMEATADGLPEKSKPTAMITDDGTKKILALGIPAGRTGPTGPTPLITFEAETGAPGTDVQLEQSGTAEAPNVRITIPRGDVGDIGKLTINGKAPDGAGAVTLDAADVGARPETWTPSAQEVGAYPEGGIRTVALSLAVSSWTGSGPYAASLPIEGVTERTWLDIRFDAASAPCQTAAIEWETSAGLITLTTASLPTGALTGTMTLMEVMA